MSEIPAQPATATTALGHLLEAHRTLIRLGYHRQAEILAQGLLDRIEVRHNGQGVLRLVTSGEALVIAQRVIDAAPVGERHLVRQAVIGI